MGVVAIFLGLASVLTCEMGEQGCFRVLEKQGEGPGEGSKDWDPATVQQEPNLCVQSVKSLMATQLRVLGIVLCFVYGAQGNF